MPDKKKKKAKVPDVIRNKTGVIGKRGKEKTTAIQDILNNVNER